MDEQTEQLGNTRSELKSSNEVLRVVLAAFFGTPISAAALVSIGLILAGRTLSGLLTVIAVCSVFFVVNWISFPAAYVLGLDVLVFILLSVSVLMIHVIGVNLPGYRVPGWVATFVILCFFNALILMYYVIFDQK